jgi:hypothetical protein
MLPIFRQQEAAAAQRRPGPQEQVLMTQFGESRMMKMETE